MFIDELVDSGMDSSGGENALAVLKHITREKKKNIFLISHKDEFVARVSNVLMVTKENGFTEYKYETDLQI
jgi:ABC-type dipeptide/oligopeptide/nickel transport system ATPase subunit